MSNKQFVSKQKKQSKTGEKKQQSVAKTMHHACSNLERKYQSF
jgi:hypothetical protein